MVYVFTPSQGHWFISAGSGNTNPLRAKSAVTGRENTGATLEAMQTGLSLEDQYTVVVSRDDISPRGTDSRMRIQPASDPRQTSLPSQSKNSPQKS
jgi:hypothetical protein